MAVRLACGDRGALLGFAGVKGTGAPAQGGLQAEESAAGGYLVPEPVLAIGLLAEPGAGLPEPARACSRLREMAVRHQARHLLLEDPRVTIPYLGELLAARLPEEPPSGLGVQCRLGDGQGLEMLERAREAGLRMILWHQPAGPLNPLTRGLWRLAKTGIWNHLLSAAPEPGAEPAESLRRFAAANPNVIHSWSPVEPPAGYGQVPDLPGRPLWQALPEQAYWLLYLGRHGAAQVERWRTTEGGRSVYTVGGRLEYHFVRPEELPAGYLELICRMVEAGGSVGSRWVRHNLENAFLIGYVEEHGRLVANSSLKRPRREYVARVSEQSGIDLREYLERGYTSVRPEYRGLGIGTRLLEGLTERAEGRKIFSVIGADNVATQKIALRNQTRRVAAFYSEALGKEIGVWIPEWMLED